MGAELGKREVAAPVKDWLSKAEVCGMIEVSERTLDRLIEQGEFPRAVQFPGENKMRWRWVDVTWYLLGREVSDRLIVSATDDTEGDNGAQPAANRTPRPAK